MFKSLFKAAIGTVLLPVNVVKDIVNLPVSAYEDTDPFGSTKNACNKIAENIDKVVE